MVRGRSCLAPHAVQCRVCARWTLTRVGRTRGVNINKSTRTTYRTRGRKANSDRRRYLFCSVRCPDDAQWRTIWRRGRTPCRHMHAHKSQHTHGSCSRAIGYGGPSNINTASPSPHPSLHSPSAKGDHPPDPSHHPDPSHTTSNRDSTNTVRRCTRQNSLLKSNRPEDLCFCRRRCSHCGGGARGGHRRRIRPSFGRCLCRRRLGR